MNYVALDLDGLVQNHVMPAKAGIQNHSLSLDSRLRWNDKK